jgi:hypothetical protein
MFTRNTITIVLSFTAKWDSNMKFYEGDWVIPKGTKEILMVEEVEVYDTVVVYYTNNRNAYPEEQLSSLTEVYLKETQKA